MLRKMNNKNKRKTKTYYHWQSINHLNVLVCLIRCMKWFCVQYILSMQHSFGFVCVCISAICAFKWWRINKCIFTYCSCCTVSAVEFRANTLRCTVFLSTFIQSCWFFHVAVRFIAYIFCAPSWSLLDHIPRRIDSMHRTELHHHKFQFKYLPDTIVVLFFFLFSFLFFRFLH